MKTPRRPATKGAAVLPAPEVVDALYGLEPAIESTTRDEGAGLGEFVVVQCPYCAESYETPIDLTSGSSTFIEDCQVCCQPIELEVRLGEDGAVESLGVRRLD